MDDILSILYNFSIPVIISLLLCFPILIVMGEINLYNKNNKKEVKSMVLARDIVLLILLNYIPAILVYYLYFKLAIIGFVYSGIIACITLWNTKVINKNGVLIFVNLHLLVINSIATWFAFKENITNDIEGNMIMSLALYVLLLVNAITIIALTIFGIKNRKPILGFWHERVNSLKGSKNCFKKFKEAHLKNKTEEANDKNDKKTLEERIMYAYTGKNASKVLEARVNISAALLGPIWYFNKKLYSLAIKCFLIYLISPCLLAVILWLPLEGPGVAGLFEVLIILCWLMLTIVGLIIALFINLFNANKFYKNYMGNIINKIIKDNQSVDEEMLVELVREKMGKSILKPVIKSFNDKLRINMKKLVIWIMSIFLMILLFMGINFIGKKMNEENILFQVTYSYEFGSEYIIIYKNGDVYTDIEMESPHYKPKYTKKTTLTEEEVVGLKLRLTEEVNHNELKRYINKLIHGNEDFNPFANIKMVF